MPTPPPKNHYELLGVSRTATTDEIKKRYRELARKLHPDVNPDKAGAARLFADVTTAYKTLSDADSRAVYDYDQGRQDEQRARAAARATSTYTPPPTSPFNAPPRGGAASPGAGSAGRPGGAPSGGGADVSRLVAEAQAAFVRNKLVEARSLAQEALRLNRRNAQAYEVLGDVYRLQGKTEEAMNMYTMALQINPRNSAVMQRLERMSRAAGSANRYGEGASADRVFFSNRDTPPAPGGRGGARPFQGPGAARPAGRPVSSYGPPDPSDKRPIGLLLTGVFGYGGVFLLLLWATLFLGDTTGGKLKPFAPDLAPISTWSGPLLFVMVLCGLVLGATMAITGAVRRIDDELLLPGSGMASSLKSGPVAPLGLLLLVVSVVSFYAAATLYVIVAALQEIAMKSMLRVFAAVIVITLLLAAVYDPGHVQVLLFGGNVVFLAFAFGWFLGDFFRPDVF